MSNAKKQWKKPEIFLLDRGPQGGGPDSLILEHTGHRLGFAPSVKATNSRQLIVNQPGTTNTEYRFAHS